MAFDPVFLSRLQFAFVITFHIMFLSFTIGLGAWLATSRGTWGRSGCGGGRCLSFTAPADITLIPCTTKAPRMIDLDRL
jgi:hypothetical protein